MFKLPKRLRPIAYAENFRKPFNDCIHNSEIQEEFESRWVDVIKKNNLEGNDWLHHLYTVKHSWVPAYLRHIFFVGMSSSQRSDSINAIVDKYVSKKTTLVELLFQVDSTLERQRELELNEDFDSRNSHPVLKTSFKMEKQMELIYTKHNFTIFQEEVLKSIDYIVHCLDESENL